MEDGHGKNLIRGKGGDEMRPHEIVVVSGKGGTGKTSLSSALCAKAASKAVFADTDVDAPDLWILLKPEDKERFDFHGLEKAKIDPERCIGCSKCLETCRFSAIKMIKGLASVNTTFCEGCGACTYVCPQGCISMERMIQGHYSMGETEYGPLWHALLNPGGENSGMLVSMIRRASVKTAEERGLPIIIIDGPPGVACPAISTLTGADMAVVVTEPTLSGWHDLERVGELCRNLRVAMAVVINKSDLAPEEAKRIVGKCFERGWTVLGTIPFRREVVDAVSESRPPLKELSPEIDDIWQKIVSSLNLDV